MFWLPCVEGMSTMMGTESSSRDADEEEATGVCKAFLQLG